MPFDVTPDSRSTLPSGPAPASDPPPAVPHATPAFAPVEYAAPRTSSDPGTGPSGVLPGLGRPGAGDLGGAVFAPPPQPRRRGGFLVAGLAAMLVVVGLGGALAWFGGRPSNPAAGEVKGPGEVYRIGEPAPVGSVSFTVLGVRTLPVSEFAPPTEGFTHIAVHVEAENHGERTSVVSSIAQFSVRDSSGLTYDFAFTDGLVGSLDGTLPPGSKLRGEVAFEVPAGMTGLQLVISDFIFAGSAVVQLN